MLCSPGPINSSEYRPPVPQPASRTTDEPGKVLCIFDLKLTSRRLEWLSIPVSTPGPAAYQVSPNSMAVFEKYEILKVFAAAF